MNFAFSPWTTSKFFSSPPGIKVDLAAKYQILSHMFITSPASWIAHPDHINKGRFMTTSSLNYISESSHLSIAHTCPHNDLSLCDPDRLSSRQADYAVSWVNDAPLITKICRTLIYLSPLVTSLAVYAYNRQSPVNILGNEIFLCSTRNYLSEGNTWAPKFYIISWIDIILYE